MLTFNQAIDIAIKVLTKERRLHAAGEAAFTQQGITDLTFAVTGHKRYEEYADAIRQLEDLKEVLSDPGVTHDQTTLPGFS